MLHIHRFADDQEMREVDSKCTKVAEEYEEDVLTVGFF